MKMEETVEVVRERERERDSLENKVALKKDATTISYANMRNCWTVWRERATIYSNKKKEKNTLNKVDIIEKSYIIRKYNRHY